MKKGFSISTIFASLIAFGCIFICFGYGVTTNNTSIAIHCSFYDLMFGYYHVIGLIVTWAILLVATVVTFLGGLMIAMDKKAGAVVSILGGLLCVVCGILFWFAHIFVGAEIGAAQGANIICGPNVAEGFNGVLMILAGLIAGFSGLAAKGSQNA